MRDFPFFTLRRNLFNMMASIRQIIEVNVSDLLVEVKRQIIEEAATKNMAYYETSKKYDILVTVEIVPSEPEKIERG